jgi:hypothetical protein
VILLLALLQDPTLESSLQKLYESLDKTQREACLKPYDDPDRDAEVFFPGERKGLLIKGLTSDQFKQLESAIQLFLSKEGYAEAMKVASQSHKEEGLRGYYLNFFGDPTAGKDWAFRVSEHHLTLVHVASDPKMFGPILLGSNPPELWREQEDAAIACFAALTKEDRAKVELDGKAMSGEALKERGAPQSELSDGARKAVKSMIAARFKLFSDPQQEKLRAIFEEAGDFRVAFFGEMTKRSSEGGTADVKIEGAGFLMDYESNRGHIHMTVRGRAK